MGQLWSWVYQWGVTDVARMTTFGAKARDILSETFTFTLPEVVEDQVSQDGTRKWLVRFAGPKPPAASAGGESIVHVEGSPLTPVRRTGGQVETVFIPETTRATACLSSQVGCSLSCSFCRTGAMSKKGLRNLSSGEIVGQVLVQRLAFRDFPSSADDRLVSNIVMMGMGEPLLNYRSVKAALETIMDGDGLSISKRRITVSTSGIVPIITRLGRDLDVNLAISLHAVRDDLRDVLVPINKTHPLKELIQACR